MRGDSAIAAKATCLGLTLGALLAIGGCTTARTEAMASTAAPARITVPAGKASIAFIQPDGAGGTVLRVFNEKGFWLGDLGGKNWFVANVDPGKHTFVATFAAQCLACSIKIADTVLRADVVAGQTYFVRVDTSMGMWKGDATMTAIRPGSPDQRQLGAWMRELEYFTPDPAQGQATLNVALTAAGDPDPMPEALAEAEEQWKSYPPEKKAAGTLNPGDAINPSR